MALFGRFFGNNKPRPFEHKYIFVDERKEKLKEMEERVRREVEGDKGEEEPYDTEKRIRGRIKEQTSHLRRRSESGKRPISMGMILLIIIGLFILWYFLSKGTI